MQGWFDDHGMPCVAAVAHPGLCGTRAPERTGLARESVQAWAQSAEDGTLPLLECITSPNPKPGMFLGPGEPGHEDLHGMMHDNTVGPPAPAQQTEIDADEDAMQLLWQLSEAAVGACGS